jgi:hypothetical protein
MVWVGIKRIRVLNGIGDVTGHFIADGKAIALRRALTPDEVSHFRGY